jgi:hypothetical protein
MKYRNIYIQYFIKINDSLVLQGIEDRFILGTITSGMGDTKFYDLAIKISTLWDGIPQHIQFTCIAINQNR